MLATMPSTPRPNQPSLQPNQVQTPAGQLPQGLLGLQGVPAARVRALLALARDFRAAREIPRLMEGRIVANFFLEDSTRTRTSFTVAAMALGAQVVDLLGGTSSVNKGETILDTARILESQGVAAIVVRAKQAGAALLVARGVACPVLNAGDGKHEHPTQALLDALTIADATERTDDFNFAGLTVAIVGDVATSRVARSNIAALTALGAKVVCVGSPAFAPRSLEALGVQVTTELDDVVTSADAIMMLRIQFERHGGTATASPAPAHGSTLSPPMTSSTIASVREYRAFYALTEERAKRMKPDAIVLHPGPINRGIELDAAVADGPSSRILHQARNGLFARAAALAHIAAAR